MSTANIPSPSISDASEAFIISVISASAYHMRALQACRDVLPSMPAFYISAGFIRNAVWDVMHDYNRMTPLADLDVIYYDPSDAGENTEKNWEHELQSVAPDMPWSVKNQARMHLRNNDEPYKNIEDALCHWCETVTPIAIRLIDKTNMEIIAPLGVDDLLSGNCRPTPHALKTADKLSQYRQRLIDKKWDEIWPKIKLHNLNEGGTLR